MKTLTLRGSGPSSTKVKARPALSPDSFTLLNVITVNGGVTVGISGFTISGPGPGFCGSIDNGIFVGGGAAATISGNSIVSIRDNPLSGCQNGFGIRVGCAGFRCPLMTTGRATIKSNAISDYQKGGILIDDAGSKATISRNVVIGVGPTTEIGQNGIEVTRGATAAVTQNTVSGNEYSGPGSGPDLDLQIQSTGILLCGNGCGTLGTTATSVSRNQVFDNDIGVAFSFVEGTSVSQNSITNNRAGNVVLFTSNNNFIGFNTVSISNPSAEGAPCVVLTCFPNRYTLGIDVLDSSTGNSIHRNSVSVTADNYAVLLDRSTSKNSVTCNDLRANHGATTGDAAVLNLGISNTVHNTCGQVECPQDEGSDAKTAQHEELCEEKGNGGEQGNDVAEQENEQAEQSQQNSDLSNEDLSNADFTGFDFKNSNLKGADLSGSVLQGVNLAGADLTCASLGGADLTGANLAGAILDGADLTGATLLGVDLTSTITSIGFAGCP